MGGMREGKGHQLASVGRGGGRYLTYQGVEPLFLRGLRRYAGSVALGSQGAGPAWAAQAEAGPGSQSPQRGPWGRGPGGTERPGEVSSKGEAARLLGRMTM